MLSQTNYNSHPVMEIKRNHTGLVFDKVTNSTFVGFCHSIDGGFAVMYDVQSGNRCDIDINVAEFRMVSRATPELIDKYNRVYDRSVKHVTIERSLDAASQMQAVTINSPVQQSRTSSASTTKQPSRKRENTKQALIMEDYLMLVSERKYVGGHLQPNELSKDQVIARWIEKFGMTPNGASTYYYNCKKAVQTADVAIARAAQQMA